MHESTVGVTPVEEDDASAGAPSRRPSPITFWILVSLSGITFAPCVLVPVWRDYQAIELAERLEDESLKPLRAEVERLERTLDALRTDPATVARVARRDLSYVHPGEQDVALSIVAEPADQSRPRVEPVKPPAQVARWLAWLSLDEDRLLVFADPARRPLLMCLSGALMIAAFLIFPPHRRPPTMTPGA